MLYYLSDLAQRVEALSFLRLFGYVTFRAAGAAFTAFMLVVLLGPYTVRKLKELRCHAAGHMNTDADEVEKLKSKTPSMGGILLLSAILISLALWAMPSNPLIHVFAFLLLGLGALGAYDDMQKVIHGSAKFGLSSNLKLAGQIIIGATAIFWLNSVPETKGVIRDFMVPFIKDPVWAGMPLVIAMGIGVLVIVGTSNAVNLTDGMDGLASGCTIIVALAYAVLAYICGHRIFAEYLQVPFIPGASEVVVLATAMAGGCLGFLWHNCPPAAMFMGDTGSLALGGAIALMATLVRQELLLIVIGGVFVIETLSVIIQTRYFKFSRWRTGTPVRVFLCAPIHHHFKMAGWKETQIVVRFWILGLLCAALGLATLKIR